MTDSAQIWALGCIKLHFCALTDRVRECPRARATSQIDRCNFFDRESGQARGGAKRGAHRKHGDPTLMQPRCFATRLWMSRSKGSGFIKDGQSLVWGWAMSQAETTMFEAVGRAVAAWSEVEAGLAAVMSACMDLNIRSDDAAIRSGFANHLLHTLNSTSAKLRMVNFWIDARLKDRRGFEDEDKIAAISFLERWSVLSKEVTELSVHRNQIAHRRVDSDGAELKFVLKFNSANPKSIKEIQANNYIYDEIFVRNCATKFISVGELLTKLSEDIISSTVVWVSIISDMRFVLHTWGADVNEVCELLRTPLPAHEEE